MPLVVVIHGAFDTAEGMEKITRFSQLADREGFMVLYPNGMGLLGFLQHWNAGHCCGKAADDQVDDVGFVAATIEDVCVRFKVVKLSDDDPGATEQNTTAMVTGARVKDGELQVVGTKGNDHVTINQVGKQLYRVHADFMPSSCRYLTFSASDVESIKILLGAGNDQASIAGNIDLPVTIDGGAGDDHLNSGRGPAVLIGGPGNDKLIGSWANDQICGIDWSCEPAKPRQRHEDKLPTASSWVKTFVCDLEEEAFKGIQIALPPAGDQGVAPARGRNK